MHLNLMYVVWKATVTIYSIRWQYIGTLGTSSIFYECQQLQCRPSLNETKCTKIQTSLLKNKIRNLRTLICIVAKISHG